jgi:phosphatidate cytidylyltransferase
MRKRWLTALVAMPLALAALAAPSPWPLALLGLAFVGGGARELARLCGVSVWFVLTIGLLGFCVGAYAAWEPGAWRAAMLGSAAVSAVGAGGALLLARHPGNSTLAILAGLWIGGPFGGLLAIHAAPLPGPWMGSAALLVALPVWAGDTFAIFFGRAWGRRKLAPRISPNKTVVGAVAGLAGSVLTGALAGWALGLGGPWFGAAAGAAAGLSGQLGDLLESALKRAAGVKDSGSMFPGHGGVLDRVDSLLLATPGVALVLAAFWARPI